MNFFSANVQEESNGIENTVHYFNSSHRILTSFVEMLQNNFRQQHHYSRPLISPQGNIFYAIDNDIAREMIFSIGNQLETQFGFTREEFHFTHKCGHDGSGLQRIRLEFTDGITQGMLKKIIAATARGGHTHQEALSA